MRALFLLFGLLTACAPATPGPAASALAPGDHALSLDLGGRRRSAVLHVPPARRDQPLPLLLAFHGGGGNAAGFQRYAGLDAVADREGFLVAYPNGSGRWLGARLLTWNAGGCCGYAAEAGVDDVGFALAVIDEVARRTALDPARVYATGHSNGAMMAYRLAAEASDRIAAIAPVAGAMTLARFAPARAVAVLHIHSADDPRALYAGGTTETLGRAIEHQPAEEGLARWRERDACAAEATELDARRQRDAEGREHTARLVAWAPCAEGSEVHLWKLTGGGHGWPGADPVLPERVMGPRTDVISAAEEVWRFVSRFRR